MKGRLIRDDQDQVLYLSSNGDMIPASLGLMTALLFDFKAIEDKTWISDTSWKSASVPDMAMYPGETLAIIPDDCSQLIIYDAEPFRILTEKTKGMIDVKKYISAVEYGKKHNRSCEIVKSFCRQGRIVGAYKANGTWMMPEDAPYPVRPSQLRPYVQEAHKGKSKKTK